MGGCLSFRKDKATKIVDLEEILFTMVKQDHLTLAQAMCVGKSLYLEVKIKFLCKVARNACQVDP